MGLGILEDKYMDHVPGTTRYFDDPARTLLASPDAVSTGLKYDHSGPVPIVLVPQPSDDPNDPLNWPLWRRDVITVTLSLVAIFATALGPILAANTITLTLELEVDLTKVALLTGYFLLGCGAGSIFWVPSSRIWGKRHAFVLGLMLLIGSSAWSGGVGKNYNSFIGSRVLQGIAAAPYEALTNAIVGDLYYVHERGKRMAFTNLAVFGGAFFTPILVGLITHTIMWWWTFYLVAIFCAACLPIVVLFCPETAFRRDQSLNIDMLASSSTAAQKQANTQGAARPGAPNGPSPSDDDVEKHTRAAAPQANGTSDGSSSPAPVPRTYKKKTFWQSMALFDGRKTDDNFIKLMLRPLVLFAQPAFLWGALIQGTMIGWTVFIGVVLGFFFIGYPLWWDEVRTGYAYTGAFVGALIGFLVAGALSDWSARALTRRNGGVYEPEFRIVLVIPQLILGCLGVYGFGYGADGLKSGKFHWMVVIAFFGFEVAGMVVGAVASALYIVDAYRDLAIEGLTTMIIFKNFFSYGLTYKAYDWLIENKTKATPIFNILGTVQLLICLLSIPMYIYGKRIRGYFYRHDILKATGLR